MADDSGYGTGYGSYMNFFLPKSAQVGGPSLVPSPSLYDMLPGMGGGLSQPGQPDQPGTAADQQKKQQQNLAMAQQGIKMMYPQQQQRPQPQPIPVAPPQPQQPMPQGTQVTADQPPPRPPTSGYDPRDPRSRNPMAGMPTPFGGFYR